MNKEVWIQNFFFVHDDDAIKYSIAYKTECKYKFIRNKTFNELHFKNPLGFIL